MTTETAHIHAEDPVLVLATRFNPKENGGWAWFGRHAPQDPTYEAEGWNVPFSSTTIWGPAWRGDVLRVAWKGPFTLPDERDVPSPSAIEINRTGGIWLHCHHSPEDLCFAAGTTLSDFVARMGAIGEVYLPIVGVCERTWWKWDLMRAAAYKAGRYAGWRDDEPVDGARLPLGAHAERLAEQLGLREEQRAVLVAELRNALVPALSTAAALGAATVEKGIERVLALAGAVARRK